MLVEFHWTRHHKYLLHGDDMEIVQELKTELKDKVISGLKGHCNQCGLCPGMASIGEDMELKDVNGKAVQVENCEASGYSVIL